MGEEDKKEEYKIKAGEFGFFKDFYYNDLINTGKIKVLTGKNGCGKTQILKYIELNNRKETIFSSTTINKELNKKGLEDFINELIKELNLKNHTELENALFAKDTAVYNEIRKVTQIYKLPEKNTFTYVDIICSKIESISNKTTANRFKNYFGELNEGQKLEITKKLYENLYKRIKGNNIKIQKKNSRHKEYSSNLSQNNIPKMIEYIDNYQDQQFRDESREKIEKELKNSIQELIIKDYQSFTNKLTEEIFSEIDINNLILELGTKILDDYKISEKKRKNNKTMFDKINEELKILLKEEFFLYELVEPNMNFKNYDLKFKYQSSELENQGVISFDYLSTGEKQIFTLIVYKYLLKITNKYKYLLLDEFDANLNPALINFYVETLAEISKGNTELCIIITTHSALTLKSLQKKELFQDSKAVLYELKKDIKEKNHTIKPTKGKEKIEEFIYNYSDGLLLVKESSEKDKFIQANYIILVEGTGDKEYIEKYLAIYKKKEYYVDFAGGCPSIKPEFKKLINQFKKDELQNKKFILLYDFDPEGYNSFYTCTDNGIFSDNNFMVKDDKLNSEFLILKNIEAKKDLIAMMHKPIEKENFNKDFIAFYEYSEEKNLVVSKNNKQAVDVEIEDLIVAYNVDKYKEFLKEHKQYSFDIKQFFSIDRGNTCKESVKSFFEEKHNDEDFNFAGFDELFKRIEANFKN